MSVLLVLNVSPSTLTNSKQARNYFKINNSVVLLGKKYSKNYSFSYLAENINQQLIMAFSLTLHFKLRAVTQISAHNCRNNTEGARMDLASRFV